MARRAFAALDLLVASLIVLGVFRGLPDRWWPVDMGAVFLTILFLGASAGLFLDAPWGRKAARAASTASLVLGLALVAALALSASYLMGIYGPVGRGGALILFFGVATALPYLIVFPAVQLAWLRAQRQTANAPRA